MTMNVSLWVAMLGGLLSFFSPCVLPMIPLFVGYLSGAVVKSDFDRKHHQLLIRNTLAFIFGFTLVFIALGATATTIGSLLAQYSRVLLIVFSMVLIVFGLQMMGLFSNTFFSRTWQAKSVTNRSTFWGAFLFGVVFSFGWSPCTGPVLTSILILAGTKSSIWQGIELLLAYALGLALPFLGVAFLWGHILTALKRIAPLTDRLEKIGGFVLILTGLLMLIKGVHI